MLNSVRQFEQCVDEPTSIGSLRQQNVSPTRLRAGKRKRFGLARRLASADNHQPVSIRLCDAINNCRTPAVSNQRLPKLFGSPSHGCRVCRWIGGV